jgi:hypothetical protein
MGLGEGDSKEVQGKRTWETSSGFVMARTKCEHPFYGHLKEASQGLERKGWEGG